MQNCVFRSHMCALQRCSYPASPIGLHLHHRSVATGCGSRGTAVAAGRPTPRPPYVSLGRPTP
eukprot:2484042-Prymnesium_polylepis.1